MIKISPIKISNFRSFTNEENTIDDLDDLKNIFAGRNNIWENEFKSINLFFLIPSLTIQVLIEKNAIMKLLKGAVKIVLLP